MPRNTFVPPCRSLPRALARGSSVPSFSRLWHRLIAALYRRFVWSRWLPPKPARPYVPPPPWGFNCSCNWNPPIDVRRFLQTDPRVSPPPTDGLEHGGSEHGCSRRPAGGPPIPKDAGAGPAPQLENRAEFITRSPRTAVDRYERIYRERVAARDQRQPPPTPPRRDPTFPHVITGNGDFLQTWPH